MREPDGAQGGIPELQGFRRASAPSARKRAAAPGGGGEGPGKAVDGGAGVQVGVELVAGVIGGGLLGYWLDRWFETWPVLFLVFFFLGAAAGMLNAYRYIRRASDVPEERSKDG